MSDLHGLQQEWRSLQQQYDSYEKYSLVIKLLSIAIAALLVVHSKMDGLIPVLCLCLWGQDAIWKTYQGRIEQRLLMVESAIVEQQYHKAMQYNTFWHVTRPGLFTLVLEYSRNAIRPTVLFPHVFIVALTGWLAWIS